MEKARPPGQRSRSRLRLGFAQNSLPPTGRCRSSQQLVRLQVCDQALGPRVSESRAPPDTREKGRTDPPPHAVCEKPEACAQAGRRARPSQQRQDPPQDGSLPQFPPPQSAGWLWVSVCLWTRAPRTVGLLAVTSPSLSVSSEPSAELRTSFQDGWVSFPAILSCPAPGLSPSHLPTPPLFSCLSS